MNTQTEVEQLRAQVDTLTKSHAEAVASCAVKDRALEHCLEVSAKPEVHGRYLTSDDRHIINEALYIDGPTNPLLDALAEAVKALDYWSNDEISALMCMANALTILRPFTHHKSTKGEMK